MTARKPAAHVNAVERGVRFVRWVRELVEASAWGWEL